MFNSKATGFSFFSKPCMVSVLSFEDVNDNQKIILVEELAAKENEELAVAFKCYIYRAESQAYIRYLEPNNRFIVFEDLLSQLPIHSNIGHMTSCPCDEHLLQQMLDQFKEPQYVIQDRWIMPYLRMLGPNFVHEDTFYVYDNPSKACLFPCGAAFFKKAYDTPCTPAVAISTISCIAVLFLIFYLQSTRGFGDNSLSFNGSMFGNAF